MKARQLLLLPMTPKEYETTYNHLKKLNKNNPPSVYEVIEFFYAFDTKPGIYQKPRRIK